VAAGGSGVDAYGGNSAANDVFQAGAGTCTLWGGAGNDTFTAGTGSAIFVGGSGNNVFNFINGDDGGTDTIVGFVPGNDAIALHGYGTQMPSINVAYGDSFVNLSDGTQIIVENVTNLTSASFTFS
jgi:Ca2+-binding RTX toxin-like protein